MTPPWTTLPLRAWLRETAILTLLLACSVAIWIGTFMAYTLERVNEAQQVGYQLGYAEGRLAGHPNVTYTPRVVKDGKTGAIQFIIMECRYDAER